MVHARTSLPCERFEIGFQSYARSTMLARMPKDLGGIKSLGPFGARTASGLRTQKVENTRRKPNVLKM
jgi:hypothetical protein